MASEFNADDILEVSTSGFTSGYKSRLTFGHTFGLMIVLTSDSAFGCVNQIGSNFAPKSY